MDESLWASVLRQTGKRIGTRFIDPIALSQRLGVTSRDVAATLDAVDYLCEYVASRGRYDVWENRLGYEWPFRQMVKSRKRIPSPGDKLLFAELAFLLIDDPKTTLLSRQIEGLETSYPRIRRELERVAIDPKYAERHDLELLGLAVPDTTAFALAAELRKKGAARVAASELLGSLRV